jgi:hypothetical protein
LPKGGVLFIIYEERFIISGTYYQAWKAGIGMFKSPFENGDLGATVPIKSVCFRPMITLAIVSLTAILIMAWFTMLPENMSVARFILILLIAFGL